MMSSSRAANPLCAACPSDQISRPDLALGIGHPLPDVRSTTEPSGSPGEALYRACHVDGPGETPPALSPRRGISGLPLSALTSALVSRQYPPLPLRPRRA